MNQGAGRKHSWSLIIGDQLSRSPTSSYGIPEIHKLKVMGLWYNKWWPNSKCCRLEFGPYPAGAIVTYGESGKNTQQRIALLDLHP